RQRTPSGGFRATGIRSEDSRLAQKSGRGWTRTRSLSCVRRALSAIELLARERARRSLGQPPGSPRPLHRSGCAGRERFALRSEDSNLDLPVQSVVSCRLDEPGLVRTARAAPPSTSRTREIDAAGAPSPTEGP